MSKKILKNFTILYVEDEIETQNFIFDILKKYFQSVYIASNGQEGLDVYKEKNPDIVLCDIVMPVMNGIEMCKHIKTINPHQSIAIFTAFDEHNYLKTAINMGLDKFVSKPFDAHNFFRALISIAKVLQLDIEAKQKEQEAQIQSKIKSMGEMLGNIGHQWRQPLSIISTSASGIMMSKELDFLTLEEENNMLNQIVNQTNLLSQIIDDFRNIFQDPHYKPQEINIKNVLEEAIVQMTDISKQYYINLVPNLIDCSIEQNKNQLIQVFLNIFHNTKDAFLFNDSLEERYFFIDTKIKKNSLVITFKDNAGGIKEDVIDKVFEPFFTTKHQYYGTGMGLYITHEIVNKHLNGTIDISNKEFQYNGSNYFGACIKIVLPLENEV